MIAKLKTAVALTAVALATQAAAQVTFYENDNFQGRSFSTEREIRNFNRFGFNDRASSATVIGERWEVCEDRQFRGRCMILRPGHYVSLRAMGLNDRVSSVREISRNARIDDRRYAPTPVAAAQVTFYEQPNFGGRSFTTDQSVLNFNRFGFNDRASSAEVVGDSWEVCQDIRFSGGCVILRPGRYPSLAAMGLNNRVSSVREMSVPTQRPASAQVTFYEQPNFGGRSFTTTEQIVNFRRFGFNDRASSAQVVGERWEVCEDNRFSGRCVVLRPGHYPSLVAMGLDNRVSSVRELERNARIDDRRYAPAPLTAPDFRRWDEQLYEATVTSVRAVVGTPEQRCWVERDQAAQVRGDVNMPAAIAGALIGGILGHQVGGGSGKDIATAGGVVAGAAIGANIGRNGAQPAQDVQRCENVAGQAPRPQYWDVSYNFRGEEHRVQMTAPPGATMTVNAQGQPRGN